VPALSVRRALLGLSLIVVGGVTVTLAVAAGVWVYIAIAAQCPPVCQLDPMPGWLVCGLVLAVGAAVLGAGVWVLSKR